MSLGFESTGTAVATEGDLLEPPAPAVGDKRHGRSPSRIAFDRLRNDKVAIVCLGIVVFFVLVAIFAPLLCKLEGQTPTAFNQDLIAEDTLPLIGPTSDHWFGIEPRLGRDLFARWVYGARPSLIIGFLAATLSTIVGVTMGLIAGYLGGWPPTR